MPLDIALKPVETVVFRSDVVAFGTFRCPATHPLFRDSGPCTHHTFVFPRTSTTIRHAGRSAFTATPNCVTLYNQHQEYSRSPISAADVSDWFVVADDVLAATVDLDHGRPFRGTHVPIDSETYLLQRQLFESAATADALEVDEGALAIWSRVLRRLDERSRSPVSLRDAVEDVKRVIASAPARRASLRQLAAHVEWSPFHLCREFHRITGMTISGYRHALRVRIGLDLLRDTRSDLSEIALQLGYVSHSHFTAAFRRRFGITPSRYRARS